MMATPSFHTKQSGPVTVTGRPVTVQSNAATNQEMFAFQSLKSESGVEGPAKETKCNDVVFAILFYAHLGAMIYCSVTYVPQFLQEMSSDNNNRSRKLLQWTRYLQDSSSSNNDDSTSDVDIDPSALMTILGLSLLVSLALATTTLAFMMAYAETLVKMALFFNIALFLATAIVSLAVGAFGSGGMALLLAAVTAYYTCRVWDRIPFAASNLVTACTAVKANLGLAFYAYLSVVLVFLWTMWWVMTSTATLFVMSGCQADGECQSDINGGFLFLFMLSFYWTAQVIANVVHCTVAGTVGTWWYVPSEANGCCSQAVRDSCVRSMTYSFGSICFASLVVAIIQAIREMVHSVRENGDSIVVCLAECLIACIESLVELFNRFALVYCAVHGQHFLAAGRSVMDLFRARGWTTIITDYMLDTVLSMMSIGVGLFTGLIALMVGAAMQQSSGSLGLCFAIGLIVGYAIAAVLLSVVSSAVNTVIVCYAEAPNEFQSNHPDLSNKMRQAWRQAWPNEFSY